MGDGKREGPKGRRGTSRKSPLPLPAGQGANEVETPLPQRKSRQRREEKEESREERNAQASSSFSPTSENLAIITEMETRVIPMEVELMETEEEGTPSKGNEAVDLIDLEAEL